MKRYRVKGEGEGKTLVEVLQKDSRGYTVRIKRERRWGFKEEVLLVSDRLFETCLRTGYFMEMKADKQMRTA